MLKMRNQFFMIIIFLIFLLKTFYCKSTFKADRRIRDFKSQLRKRHNLKINTSVASLARKSNLAYIRGTRSKSSETLSETEGLSQHVNGSNEAQSYSNTKTNTRIATSSNARSGANAAAKVKTYANANSNAKVQTNHQRLIPTPTQSTTKPDVVGPEIIATTPSTPNSNSSCPCPPQNSTTIIQIVCPNCTCPCPNITPFPVGSTTPITTATPMKTTPSLIPTLVPFCPPCSPPCIPMCLPGTMPVSCPPCPLPTCPTQCPLQLYPNYDKKHRI